MDRRVDGIIVTGRRTDPRPQIGRVAAPHLLQAIDDNAAPGVHRVPCRLVVRDSA